MQHSRKVSDGGVEFETHSRFMDHFGCVQPMHRNAQYAMCFPVGHHLDYARCLVHGSRSWNQGNRNCTTLAAVALCVRLFIGQADNADLGISEDRLRYAPPSELFAAIPPSCAPTGVAIWLAVKPPMTSPAA